VRLKKCPIELTNGLHVLNFGPEVLHRSRSLSVLNIQRMSLAKSLALGINIFSLASKCLWRENSLLLGSLVERAPSPRDLAVGGVACGSKTGCVVCPRSLVLLSVTVHGATIHS